MNQAPSLRASHSLSANHTNSRRGDTLVLDCGVWEDVELVQRMGEALRSSARAKCVVVTGYEGRLTSLSGEALHRLLGALAACPAPVMAAPRGATAGGSLAFTLLCDRAVLASDAEHRLELLNVGDEDWSMHVAATLARLDGALARELLLTGDAYSGFTLSERGQQGNLYSAADPLGFALDLVANVDAWAEAELVRRSEFLEQVRRIEEYARRARSAGVGPSAPERSSEAARELGARAPRDAVVSSSLQPSGVLTLTLCDRVHKNTFSDALVQDLCHAFANLPHDARVVVVTGYDQYFACGGTKQALLAIQRGAVKFTDSNVFSLPLTCELPVIAAMQGHAIGAGWAMGLFSDLTLFAEEAIYTNPYMRYGFTPGAGATLILPERLGVELARESLFTAREYRGTDLRARGLRMPVLPAAQVQKRAHHLAERAARLPRLLLTALKATFSAELRTRLPSATANEVSMHERSFVGNRETLAKIADSFGGEIPTPVGPGQEPTGVAEAASVEDDDTLERVTAYVRRSLAEELRLKPERIDSRAKFIDMGLDSVVGVTWIRRVNKEYGLTIAATKVYDYPSVEEFSRFLVDEAVRQGRLSARPREPLDIPSNAESRRAESRPSRRCIHALRAPEGGFQPQAKPVQPAKSEPHRPESASRSAGAIAVIGMAGQFPEARNLDEYWRNIEIGRDCISEVPAARWSVDELYDPSGGRGKVRSKWMGTLQEAACFDPLFFKISPHEAERMDPQQRVFLEACWLCIEDAGRDPATLSGLRCGVYVGCGGTDYGYGLNADHVDAQLFMGSSSSILAARISYLLNLQGPALAIDTACSSSLVAIAQACDSLSLRNTDLALAGGVCVIPGPTMHLMTSQAGMLSTDGRCFTFDQRANGFVPGEGVGVLLLKRLEDAERDGDKICAVIRAWGTNQDGKTNGITAPNVISQVRLEKETYERFGIDPGSIQLVETHGTGTKLGDPIEIEALKEAFGPGKASSCALGSVKSNIGHLGTAAGVAGAIKALLALQKRCLPPTIHFEQLNEHIVLDGSPFFVNTEARRWEVESGQPRRAAVSSFGFSGTNAHLVLEDYEAPLGDPHSEAAGTWIVPLSARTEPQLVESVRRLRAFLGAAPRTNHARDHFVQQVTTAVSKVLRVPSDEVDPLVPLTELGLDQVGNAQVIDELSRSLEVELDARALQGCATVSALADSLIRCLPELERASAAAAPTALFSAPCSLSELAFTLQVGRAAMEERVAFVVSGFDELLECLDNFLENPNQESSARRGAVRDGDSTLLELLESDSSLTRLTAEWARERKYSKLAALWTKGASIPWQLLYSARPRLVSLPGYPFSRERYWLSLANSPRQASDGSGARRLHALLHENVSVLEEQRFASRFSGREFFWSDHVIDGRCVLSGAAQLELALAAARRSLPPIADGGDVSLQDVVWLRPIVAGESGAELGVALSLASEDLVQFEISSLDASGRVPCSRGAVRLGASTEAGRVDLAALRGELRTRIDGGRCYALFAAAGLCYGPAHRGIVELSLGESQVLAELAVPSAVADTIAEFELHPSLLDSAFQAAVGLFASPVLLGLDVEKSSELALPFALDSLRVTGRCGARMWAWARISSSGHGVHSVDIDVCDEAGRVSLEIRGFSLRQRSLPADVSEPETTLLARRLRASSAASRVRVFRRRELVLCGFSAESARRVRARVGSASCTEITSTSDSYPQSYTEVSARLLEKIQAVLGESSGAEGTLLQLVLPLGFGGYAGLSAMLKTVMQEYPHIVCQSIGVQSGTLTEAVLEWLANDEVDPNEMELEFTEDGPQLVRWERLRVREVAPRPWKDNGVYLVTGGAGKLGQALIREILTFAPSARIVVCGRSSLDSTPNAFDGLNAAEPSLEYRQVDIASAEACQGLIQHVLEVHGKLDGILHVAGQSADGYLIDKTARELRQVFAAKVAGTFNLDQVTQGLSLDFFVVFSSLAGALGNIGQADYAAANAFCDAFARWRAGAVQRGERTGRTLSVGWPHWKDGGMALSDEARRRLEQTTGLLSLPTGAALAAFYAALACGESQLLVLYGHTRELEERLSHAASRVPTGGTPLISSGPSAAARPAASEAQIRTIVFRTVCEQLKLDLNDLDPELALTEYGLDSISVTELVSRLNQAHALKLAPTLLFEHRSAAALARYLHRNHAANFGPVVAPGALPSPRGAWSTGKRSTAAARSAVRSQPAAAKVVAEADPIAIVGISGKFPMARDLDEFWQNLARGRDCICEVPRERWDVDAIFGDPAREENKTNVRFGGFVDGVDEFDALFFGVSPREATVMDPQQRLLMTYLWTALEDAGYSAQRLAGSDTGIFVATANSGYHQLVCRAGTAIDGLSSTGTLPSLGPGRMSFLLDWHGPSEPIETACSSSLVAVHRAVEALRSGACEMAVAGGVNVIVTPDAHISFSKAGMLSVDGRCKTFSAAANGYARGEGVGMLVLKKLARAEADGDHIYAVIRSTAENHGGRASSLTAPNPRAQVELLKTAYRRAGLDLSALRYIEAHGTGTPLGDPIEVDALKAAFSELAQESGVPALAPGQCGIGSVKTNIGHLELAAGVASVIKVILQLKHGTLVQSLHAEELNPYLNLDGSPFFVVREKQPWLAPQTPDGEPLPRVAGVSSFGFGGVNAHVVIEEYRGATGLRPAVSDDARSQLIPLSARSAERLQAYASALLSFVEAAAGNDREAVDLADLSFTLQLGRDAMDHRLALVVSSTQDLVEKLRAFLDGRLSSEGLYTGEVRRGGGAARASSEEDDLRSAFDSWLEREQLEMAARFWVNGIGGDWTRLPRSRVPRRLSLPTYPFAPERHWVGDPSMPLGAEACARELVPVFRPQPLLRQPTLAGTESGLVVLCAPSCALSESVAQELGSNQLLTLPGVESLDRGESWLAAHAKVSLFLQSRLRAKALARCVLISRPADPLAQFVYPVLQCLQAELGVSVSWYQCSDSTHEVFAETVRAVIADARSAPAAARTLRLDMRNGELSAQSQHYELREMKFSAASSISECGVHWITGGAGGVGHSVAQYLAEAHAATVIVSGRSELSDAERQRIESVASRGKIIYRRADSCDFEAMQALATWIEHNYGPISGVIHAAGIVEDKALLTKDPARAREVMRPKVEGISILDRVTRTAPLRYFVAFSSLSAVLGNAGQSDYAAANAFLELFCEQRAALVATGERSGVSLAIHWPYWEHGGMRAPAERLAAWQQDLGARVLPNEIGFRIFEEAVRCGQPITRVVYGVIGDERARPSRAPRSVAPPLEQPRERSSVATTLVEILSELTGVEARKIDADAHFTDFGVDSVMLQGFVRRVNDRFQSELKAIDFHNHSSANRLATLLATDAVAPESGRRTVDSPTRRSAATSPDSTDVAIVGVNFSVPRANSLAELWRVLNEPAAGPQPYPLDRWARLPKELTAGRRREDYLGHYLPNVLGFDHRFFKISPREAMLMDPQQRLLLQCTWRALENAGYRPQEFARHPTSVFVAINSLDYADIVRADPQICEFTGAGVSRNIAAARLSQFFDLRGLSEPIDTACPSFILGLERAMNCLAQGVSEQAIVAAVQLNLLPSTFDILRELGLLSPSGHARPFDYRADGYVRGEGVAAVVLKPLERALRDKDHVYAVLKGVGVWHAGRSMSLAAPSTTAHVAAMQRALTRAGISAEQLAYIEAHGTGMALGDASEVAAFARVFEESGGRRAEPCLLSSVKGQFGHLEAASGALVLMKAIVALKHGRVPGIAGFEAPHPELGRALDYFELSRDSSAIRSSQAPLTVGLNSYGSGGISAFAVLQAGVSRPSLSGQGESVGTELFVLSAESREVLLAYLIEIERFLSESLREGPSFRLAELAATSQLGRVAMKERLALVVRSLEELLEKVRSIVQHGLPPSEPGPSSAASPDPSLVSGWLRERDWSSLAASWLAGADVPWEQRALERCPMPEYPFDTRREFWVASGVARAPAREEEASCLA